jgi:hypothetical protein
MRLFKVTILFVVEAGNIYPQRGQNTIAPMGAFAPYFLPQQLPILVLGIITKKYKNNKKTENCWTLN